MVLKALMKGLDSLSWQWAVSGGCYLGKQHSHICIRKDHDGVHVDGYVLRPEVRDVAEIAG